MHSAYGKWKVYDTGLWPSRTPVSSRESLGLSDQVENGCVLRVVSPELGKLVRVDIDFKLFGFNKPNEMNSLQRAVELTG